MQTSVADERIRLRDVKSENFTLNYRLKEWVRTQIPPSPILDDDKEIEPDPSPPKHITVKIKDLLAVQHYVNMPTVWYYVHTIRQMLDGEKDFHVDPVRVKKWSNKWILVNGTHRVEAFRYLKYKEIPAIWGWE